ncbi:MAG: alpha/beta fold hydrolase [Betaproteobacteria bacterium]|nr:MAG: alpha/beta fold hydrolase [Betaproteobacteria bacterium]
MKYVRASLLAAFTLIAMQPNSSAQLPPSAATPPSFDATAQETRMFYFPSREVRPMNTLGAAEVAVVRAGEPTTYGYLMSPASRAHEASVFFLHGAGANATHFEAMYVPLISGGFQVFAYDWRGYGKSEGVSTHLGARSDVIAAFDQFVSRPDVVGKPVVVYGQSIGGQLAIALANARRERITALVVDGSATSFLDLAIDNAPSPALKAALTTNPAIVSEPYRAIDDIARLNALPKLIIQSADDTNVPRARGEALFAAAATPKQFWLTQGPHIATLTRFPDETVQRLRALLKPPAQQ